MIDRLILVGDNPFHGVSHISQERAFQRSGGILGAKHAAELVLTSVNSGANGFTFTVSETSLSILREINQYELSDRLPLYPLVPNVNEVVRNTTSFGGVSGLAQSMAKKMATVINFELLANLTGGVLRNRPELILRAYLKWEYLKLQKALGGTKSAYLASIILHEVVTDMALALDMQWLFQAHIDYMRKLKLKPGFETRNLPYLIKQFKKWHINIRGIVIEAPFNPIGFQMCPSQADCEKALNGTDGSEVIAFSVLAAGYVRLQEALGYAHSLPGLCGVAIGISNEKQAVETFTMAKQILADG
ncbi:hypothetical protein ACFLUU_06480 [Chloroflexota bacterium]